MTGFDPYLYVPQYAEGGAPVAQPAVGSGEGAGSSVRGPFSLLAGSTATDLEHVGWIGNDGKATSSPTPIGPGVSTFSYAVLEKFLCVPEDGALATMSLMISSVVPVGQGARPLPFRIVDEASVAAAMSITIMQIDRQNRLRSPEEQDQQVIYGPEKIAMCDHRVRRLRPVASIKPGVPMYLRIVSVMTAALSGAWDPYSGVPQYTSTPVTEAFNVFYSIPISVSRVAR